MVKKKDYKKIHMELDNLRDQTQACARKLSANIEFNKGVMAGLARAELVILRNSKM